MATSGQFCAIAAVNDDAIAAACLRRSPDIAEGSLSLHEIGGAETMGAAYNQGLAGTDAPYVILLHQDVYLPEGWLARAAEEIRRLESAHPDWAVAGIYGLTTAGRHAGRVWDAVFGHELTSSVQLPAEVQSLDELLLIVRRDRFAGFDPNLPSFHLYGTDAVQSALQSGHGAFALDLPVVHNNRPIESLGGGYADAYRYMQAKWSDRLPIATSVCTLSSNPWHLARVRLRRWRAKVERGGLLGDARDFARKAGYE